MERNIFEFILARKKHKHHNDEDWEPREHATHTGAMPGTWAKVNEMRKRLERGEEMWHKEDGDIDLR
jgi:hypothetical protein